MSAMIKDGVANLDNCRCDPIKGNSVLLSHYYMLTHYKGSKEEQEDEQDEILAVVVVTTIFCDETFCTLSNYGGNVPEFSAESLCLRQGMASSGRL